MPVSGAEPGVSSNQSVQINVRGKITNEGSISEVNREVGGVTSAAVGCFTFCVGACVLCFHTAWFNTMERQTKLRSVAHKVLHVSVYVYVNFVLGCFERINSTAFVMWPLLDSLEAIDQLDPFVFQAFQTLSISITLLWQKLNFLWCIFMYPKCCSVRTGSIPFQVAWWCKNTMGLNREKKGEMDFILMWVLAFM